MPAPTREQKIREYCKRCAFTPREAEVFERLITTEDGVQEIADQMFISRRVLQRYIASIYQKTGTKTRAGLYKSCMEPDEQLRSGV